LRFLILLAILGYGGLVLLALMSDRVIFQPHSAGYRLEDLAPAGLTGVQPLTFASGQFQLAAVYLPNPSARYTLLVSHGNAEDLGDDLPLLAEFHRAGFAVFAYDYRGYGASGGASSGKSLYADVEAAYQYLTGNLHVAPDRIIVFGRSLGCAAAIHLAGIHSVAGLIIEAPFLSAFRVLTRIRLLPWDRFNNAAAIRRVHCPVLIIHGRSDEVVPWWHGEHLYQLANSPKRNLWVDGAGHNDVLMVAPQRYFAAVKEFLPLLDAGQGTSGGTWSEEHPP
jgi:hypothetical protein